MRRSKSLRAHPPEGLYFELFDALGRLLLNRELNRYYTYVEVDQLPSAAYFYRVVSGGRRLRGGKLLVRH